MDARDVFGIIVRSVGLAGIVHGLPGLQGILNPPEGFDSLNYLVGYGTEVVGGLVLLFGAGPIVWLSYLGCGGPAGKSQES
jgi:hypothetical protein